MALREELVSGVRTALRRGWDGARNNPALVVLFVVMAGILGVGFWFRARGFLYDTFPFWLDEAYWVVRIYTRPLIQSLIRPIGFLAVSKFLADNLSASETVLRAFPWAAGVLAMFLSPFVAWRLYSGLAARLLFVGIVALSPCAIDFAKEYKPYSVSLAFHLGLVLLALRYYRTARGTDLGAALGVATVGSLFTQDLVMAYPGFFLVLGLASLKNGRSHMLAVGIVAFVIVLGLGTQYVVMWKNLPPGMSEKWGNKYAVFYTADQGGNYFNWSLSRFADVAAMPGLRRTLWEIDWVSFDERQDFRAADRLLWIFLFIVGLAVLAFRRRWREALLIVLPLGLLWAFNIAGFWPLGAFRTNVFTVVYTGAIAAMAFDMPFSDRERWLSLVPTAILVILPIALFEKTWHSRKRTFTHSSSFPSVLERLSRMPPPHRPERRELLLLDQRSCEPWRYYTQYHPTHGPKYAARLEASYDVRCVKNDLTITDAIREGVASHRRVWTVLHTPRPLDDAIRHGDMNDLRTVARNRIGPQTIMAFIRRR